MPITFSRTVAIRVDLPRAEAMALFTADGERRWAHGWDPHHPDPARREGPGAVFVTAHSDPPTTWVMVDQQQRAVRYTRVTPGVVAGTVAVEVTRDDERATHVAVTYDLTALSPAGEQWLTAFAADYDADIASWERDIRAALQAA
jgi:hypothetical protein